MQNRARGGARWRKGRVEKKRQEPVKEPKAKYMYMLRLLQDSGPRLIEALGLIRINRNFKLNATSIFLGHSCK